MLAAALLGVFLIPMLYVVFQWLREKVSRQRRGRAGARPRRTARRRRPNRSQPVSARNAQPVMRRSSTAKTAYMPTPMSATTIRPANTSGTLKLEEAWSIR